MNEREEYLSSSEQKAAKGSYVEAIADFVKERGGGVSFVELRRFLAPYIEVKGDLALFLPGYENIILWAGMSQAFFDALAKALSTHLIETRPTQALVYMVDGGMLKMPLARSARQYKEPHWLPVTFSPYVPDKPARKREKK